MFSETSLLTICIPVFSAIISAVIIPGRKIVGIGSTNNTVDSIPISQEPPSRIPSIFPSKSCNTCIAFVGEGLPEIFAEGAQTGPDFLIMLMQLGDLAF